MSGRSVSRRRRLPGVVEVLPVPYLIGAGLVVVVLLLGVVGSVVGSQTSVLSSVTVATPSVDPRLEAELMSGEQVVNTGSVSLVPGGGSGASQIEAPPAFAAVEDVSLHLPVPTVGGVVFSEADSASALPLAPVGTMTENANPEGYDAPDALPGPIEYTVRAPISGARPATGLVAVLAAPGTPLQAPVQGEVDSVSSYQTPQGQQAWRVTVRPQGRTDLQVVIRGLEVPYVASGDPVTVGMTELGVLHGGATIEGPLNPLSLPAALIHVRPATDDATDDDGSDQEAPAAVAGTSAG